MSDCKHLDIDDEVCQDCGKIFEDNIMEIEQIFRDGDNDIIEISKKKPKFCYITELSKLEGICEEVKMLVYNKINTMDKKSHIRVNTHRKNLFIFIYIAYNTLELSFNPYQIGLDLGLNPRSIRLAIKTASEGTDGVKNPICMIPPSFYFNELKFKFKDIYNIKDENIKKLTELSNRILEENHMLYNERPIGIAVALLKMFLEHNSKKINTDFYSTCGMTPGYVKLIESIIISTLNNEKS